MCGLYGSLGYRPDPARIDMVAHRGPDGRGWQTWESACGPVALGHRRLSIIDVSDAGLQPMASPCGQIHLVFNGEIYNYVELRQELKGRGEIFTTQSDSEVLLRAYRVWGTDCLSRLRGMFALVIWDERVKRLFAARDRFGIKPLYLAMHGDRVAFASEIKQLLGLPGVSGRMNVARVHDFLASGISDHTDATLFDGVRQLRGGEFMIIEAGTSPPRTAIRRWYAIVSNPIELSPAEAQRRFLQTLDDAVQLHLRSDVRVGSCLSGGLDSSSIVCLMARHMPAGETVHTVSACYEQASGVDETPFMKLVTDQTGAVPHYIFPRAEDIFQRASDITWHQDEPFGSTSIFAQWCVFEEARRVGIKVMLDGQGADEQLAGYHFAFAYHAARLLRAGRIGELTRALADNRRDHHVPLASQLVRAIVPSLPASFEPALQRLRQRYRAYDWLGSSLLQEGGNPSSALDVASRSVGLAPPHDIASLCVVMTFASNLQMLLHWEDRSSMAHSIEARVPFLDHELVELSLSFGNEHKIVGSDTKRVLRDAMTGILPEQVRRRRDKLGFATPEQAWFRGPLRGAMHDGVEATLQRYPDLLNARGVRRLRDDMLHGRRRTEASLWRIVNLGMWGERFGVAL